MTCHLIPSRSFTKFLVQLILVRSSTPLVVYLEYRTCTQSFCKVKGVPVPTRTRTLGGVDLSSGSAGWPLCPTYLLKVLYFR